MKRTKRPTDLKIIFEKKALINTYFENACEYVTVKDLRERLWEMLRDVLMYLTLKR